MESNEQLWLDVLQKLKDGKINNKQASKQLGMALSTFYKKKRKFIKDYQIFSEAIITPKVEDVKKECIGIKKNGFEFEFNKTTDIALFKALLGVLNDL